MADSNIPNKSTAGGSAFNSSGASQGPGSVPRKGSFINFFLALKHINQASVADSVKQRFSDYVTIGLVIVCILSLIAAVVLPVAASIRLLPLAFTVGAVIFYIVNRLGIILSLTQRQALLVWQILIAAFWLGVTSSMLIMIACVYVFNLGSL